MIEVVGVTCCSEVSDVTSGESIGVTGVVVSFAETAPVPPATAAARAVSDAVFVIVFLHLLLIVWPLCMRWNVMNHAWYCLYV